MDKELEEFKKSLPDPKEIKKIVDE